MLQNISQYIIDNKLNEVIGLISLLVSLIGFAVTIVGVFLSRSAAKAAELAATDAKHAVRQLDIVVDISAILTMMEEIKEHHRNSQWPALPYRYAILRSKLISINSSPFEFTERHRKVIEDVIGHFSKLEAAIEKVVAGKAPPPAFERLNASISTQIDGLTAVLSDLKSRIDGR